MRNTSMFRILIFAVPLLTTCVNGHAEEVMLFNGKSLAGWTTLDGQPVTNGWEVVDGMIHLERTRPSGGHIITTREFGDFVLDFQWKISPGGNSGLKYRVRDYDGDMRGLEYQIIDDLGYRHPLPPKGQTGALYALYKPNQQKRLNPPGEFNSSRIVVQNDKIQHWLNGQLIVSATVGDEQWDRRVAESKFEEYKDFGRNGRGKIMLTDHYSEVWYRAFKFMILPTEQTEAATGAK